jgi:hypothetical protein
MEKFSCLSFCLLYFKLSLCAHCVRCYLRSSLWTCCMLLSALHACCINKQVLLLAHWYWPDSVDWHWRSIRRGLFHSTDDRCARAHVGSYGSPLVQCQRVNNRSHAVSSRSLHAAWDTTQGITCKWNEKFESYSHSVYKIKFTTIFVCFFNGYIVYETY